MSEATTPEATTTPAAAPARKPKVKLIAQVEAASCTGCNYCVDWCPVPGCLEVKGGEQVEGVLGICVVDESICIGCLLCEKYCPYDAIKVVPEGATPDYWHYKSSNPPEHS